MPWTQIGNIRGPQGEPGPPGGALYTHDQTTPANPWIVTHNLNRKPHVTLIIDGIRVYADVTYTGLNQVTISFPVPTIGTAVIS